ncbi:MAG: GntR family transcriptional regulator [Rhodospirillales bacterium]
MASHIRNQNDSAAKRTRQVGAEKTATSVQRPSIQRTRVDELFQRLADDIVEGRLPPGSHLDEQTLADRFRVSRTPVREALGQLAAAGLAEKRPHRGVIVADFSPEKLFQMFEVLAELEAACARLSAERMAPAERKALEAQHVHLRDIVRSGDQERYETENRRFHAAIHEGCRNPALCDAALETRRRLTPFRQAPFQAMSGLADSFAEHDEIVRALLSGDGERAYKAMRSHILTRKVGANGEPL